LLAAGPRGIAIVESQLHTLEDRRVEAREAELKSRTSLRTFKKVGSRYHRKLARAEFVGRELQSANQRAASR